MGGAALPQLLEASEQGNRHKSVIMVFLAGGPPHQDMVDLKPNAPSEIRGEFKPISTAVPGIQICEHLPLLAQRMDRLAIIRSLVGSRDRHESFQCMTGRQRDGQPTGGWPSLGSVISKMKGPAAKGVPPFVGLSPRMKSSGWQDPGQSGFLGQAHSAFTPNADGAASLVLQGIDVNQLDDRKRLLGRLDAFQRRAENVAEFQGVDAFTEQALGILTSSNLADALDISKESPRTLERYGGGSYEPAGYGDSASLHNHYLLAARRLVESGVRCVTLAYGRWDWHGQPHGTNFENARDHLPFLDQGVSALIDDLYDRGLDRDVTVIVWGEFGRTPRINARGGRDHWPRVGCGMMFGGGLRTGQVIGETNRLGEEPIDRPVHFQEVFATIYRNLGINTNTATISDLHGRPRYLVDHSKHRPISELL
jgi:hypothetical protein